MYYKIGSFLFCIFMCFAVFAESQDDTDDLYEEEIGYEENFDSDEVALSDLENNSFEVEEDSDEIALLESDVDTKLAAPLKEEKTPVVQEKKLKEKQAKPFLSRPRTRKQKSRAALQAQAKISEKNKSQAESTVLAPNKETGPIDSSTKKINQPIVPSKEAMLPGLSKTETKQASIPQEKGIDPIVPNQQAPQANSSQKETLQPVTPTSTDAVSKEPKKIARR